MENESKNNVEALFEHAGDYLDTRLDLFKLQVIQKTSDIVSSLASRLILIVIIVIFVMIANIGIALVLGEWMGKIYYGFFALAGFYLIVGVIFNAFKSKWIKEPVANSIIRKAFK
jgi:hypothetical protein